MGKEIIEDDGLPVQVERKGINQFDFYVSVGDLNQWVKLPIISSKQLRESKKHKLYLSGNLKKDLNYLGFPGSEEHFLKALLA